MICNSTLWQGQTRCSQVHVYTKQLLSLLLIIKMRNIVFSGKGMSQKTPISVRGSNSVDTRINYKGANSSGVMGCITVSNISEM